MSTKASPGEWDCYASALPTEPMFPLLARDISAPHWVRIWADAREASILAGHTALSDQEQVEEARACATQMADWRQNNNGLWVNQRTINPAAPVDLNSDFSKTNPGLYDFYSLALDDEPMFILLGRDRSAPLWVRIWAQAREAAIILQHVPTTDIKQVSEAQRCASLMIQWRKANYGLWWGSNKPAAIGERMA